MSVVLNNVSFSYRDSSVLCDISFVANEGSLISVLGPNGAGKSTLLKCILGILKNYSGSITIDGSEAAKLRAEELSKRIAYIPQLHYQTFDYSVLDMVLMGTGSELSVWSCPGKEQIKKAEDALDRLGIASLTDRGFASLSGGEQQLVLMARAIAQDARTWILDEPTSGLDFGNRIRVLSQLRKMADAGYTILMSTHDPEQTFLFSDRIVALKAGRVAAFGSPKETLNEELIRELYGIKVGIESLHDDRLRVCVPKEIVEGDAADNTP